MVTHLSILFSLVLVAGIAIANADEERERKVRVALALAASDRAPPAPSPRVVALPNYAESYALALKNGEPLVVYVGCDGRHPLRFGLIERLPNVVVGAAKELPGYERGTVVVGYPRARKLFVHATLKCPDHGAAVAKVAEEARKKIAAPPASALAAPVPLNWSVLAGSCVCGSNCACPGGVCPQRCPVLK